MAGPLSPKLPWELANPAWAAALNPVVASPLNQIQIIKNYSLGSGSNVINHMLGRMMVGWFLIDPQGSAIVYRSAPLNNLTLTLTSSAAIISSIGVF